ncbi:hypothetical protein [Kutzneria sp. CA-103260]|uniref:hypothetical protein n=1 Tax=Kutzneria sp. CA-103260 TaxID=2802641 RepID=UPI001BA5B8F0|nr:hypothetical protein [Kutzneria sp. CA-103260]QUQ65564.1 hypothetical protein JJ691_32880 [Kutzneria sp. CA-103260]
MIIQWCVKGLHLPDDGTARSLIDTRAGLVCNWWREVHKISPREIRDRLTPGNIDRHVNHFTENDPATGLPFSRHSPFISLSAGTVERDTLAATNHVHRARKTALWFGTEFGKHEFAYLYTCWVLLAPRAAVRIEGVAEEVRDLNAYRRYSAYQTEGEVAAKVIVPDNQIAACEKWVLDPPANQFRKVWTQQNPRFNPPEILSNVRELI